jgi:hypothetical protein
MSSECGMTLRNDPRAESYELFGKSGDALDKRKSRRDGNLRERPTRQMFPVSLGSHAGSHHGRYLERCWQLEYIRV